MFLSIPTVVARHIQLCALALGVLWGAFFPLAAAELFVATAGDDRAAGTKEAPLATIQAGCDRAGSGDTITVAEGIYREHVEINKSGSQAAGFITLQAVAGAIIEGNTGTRDLIQIYDQSYIRVIGFEIRDHRSAKEASGVRIEGSGSHIEIRNNTIHNIRGKNAMGITVYGTSPDSPLRKIVIDGNTIHDCDPAKSEALTLNGNIDGFEVTNNVVHDVNNIGIDFIGGEESILHDASKVTRNGICARNRVTRARSSYGGGYAAGIYVDGARNIIIEENVVSECDIGIEVGAENAAAIASAIHVRNNTLYQNDKAGIIVGGYNKKVGTVTDCTIEGNVCYQNTNHKKSVAELWIQFASGNRFFNNVIVGVGSKPLLFVESGGKKNVIEENTWYSPDEERTEFGWGGKELLGLEKFQRQSEQGKGGVFVLPHFSDPAGGDFTRIEKALPPCH